MNIAKIENYIVGLGVRDRHEARTIAHDALLYDNKPSYQFTYARSKAYDYHRARSSYEKRHLLLVDDTSEENRYLREELLTDKTSRVSEVAQDQRQLIQALTSDSDETTTAIVETWLSSDKPTYTNVGKKLGINHTSVKRKLVKLSEKFDKSIHGELHEYFI